MTATFTEQAVSLLLALLAGVALIGWSLTGPRLHRAAQLYRTRGLRYTLASAWREAGRIES